jgi:hypothetical protein
MEKEDSRKTWWTISRRKQVEKTLLASLGTGWLCWTWADRGGRSREVGRWVGRQVGRVREKARGVKLMMRPVHKKSKRQLYFTPLFPTPHRTPAFHHFTDHHCCPEIKN